MESNFDPGKITFEILQRRLIKFINTRILNGDFTERGLAKIMGVSQPQIHNVLKGARRLQPELADRLIRKFGMTVLDLVDSHELYEEVLARGAVEVSNEPSRIQVGDHIPPMRFRPEAPPKKKPSGYEAKNLQLDSEKAS
jgi:plasmid maintenance system antidote protein VapI